MQARACWRASHRLVCGAGRQDKLVEGVEAEAVDLGLMRLHLLSPGCIQHTFIRTSEAPDMLLD